MEWLSNIVKIVELKLKPRYFFILCLLGVLLIFLPQNIKDQMSLEIPSQIKPWLGLATLAFLSVWIVQVFYSALDWFKIKARKAEILKQIDTLSNSERDIFILCLADNRRTFNRSIVDTTAHGLSSKGLVVRAGGTGDGTSWPHTIPSFVWEYLTDNKDSLFPELSSETAMRDYYERQKYNWMSL